YAQRERLSTPLSGTSVGGAASASVARRAAIIAQPVNAGVTPPVLPVTVITAESTLLRGVGSRRGCAATATFLIVPAERVRAATTTTTRAPGGSVVILQVTRCPEVVQLPRVVDAERSSSLGSTLSMIRTRSA